MPAAARSVTDCLRYLVRSRSVLVPPNPRFSRPASFPLLNLNAAAAGARSITLQGDNAPSTLGTPARAAGHSSPQPTASQKLNNWSSTGKKENKRSRSKENGEASRLERLARDKEMPTERLYEELEMAANNGRHEDVRRIARYLLTERDQKPNAKLYSALILVNVAPETGSAAAVGVIVEEMQTEGIDLDARICHNILEVGGLLLKESDQFVDGFAKLVCRCSPCMLTISCGMKSSIICASGGLLLLKMVTISLLPVYYARPNLRWL